MHEDGSVTMSEETIGSSVGQKPLTATAAALNASLISSIGVARSSP